LFYRDGWLIPEDQTGPPVRATENNRVLVASVENGDHSPEPVAFDLEAEGRAQFLTLLQVPNRDLLLVCYVDQTKVQSELKLGLFNASGVSVGGPIALAAGATLLHRCTLTWSGSSFLATWIEGELSAPQSVQARHVRMH
jgi:hypothetical protein